MDSVNSFAIVAYVAGPIARFTDRLRQELAPGCPHHAHITVLPPRPLYCTVSQATEFARQLVSQFDPFDVRIGGVELFPGTEAIYLSVVDGACELTAMHDVLNTGFFEREDVHAYVPHITLGQDLRPESVHEFLKLSRQRWGEFGAALPIGIEAVTFVQQNADGSWKDLSELGLGRVPAVG